MTVWKTARGTAQLVGDLRVAAVETERKQDLRRHLYRILRTYHRGDLVSDPVNVANLTNMLNDTLHRVAAANQIRHLISGIREVLEDDSTQFVLVGELAGPMALFEKTKARGDATGRSKTMVAGVGFEPTTFRL